VLSFNVTYSQKGEINTNSVLKIWAASGHRKITLAFDNVKQVNDLLWAVLILTRKCSFCHIIASDLIDNFLKLLLGFLKIKDCAP
jgi:hypothetical protein